MPPLPRTPPAPPCNNAGAQSSQLVNVPAEYMYSHTSLHCAELFTLYSYAHNRQHDTDFNPDMMTDAGTSTG